MTEHGDKETRTLQAELSEEELHSRIQAYADLDGQIEQTEQEKKENADGYNETLKDLREQRKDIRAEVVSEKQDLEVDCVWEGDYPHSRWELKREDTGEVIETDTMTKEELQAKLDFDNDATAYDKKNGKSPKRGKRTGEREEE